MSFPDLSREVKVAFVGDLQITNFLNSKIGSIAIPDADMVFGNLENPLSTIGYPSNKSLNYRSDPKLVSEIKQMNFRALTLANNHILDYGFEALWETIDVLRANGISGIGAGSNLAEALKPAIFNISGLKVGFLSAATTLPLDSAAKVDKPGIAPIRIKTFVYVDPGYELEEPGYGYTQPEMIHKINGDDLTSVSNSVRELKREVDFVSVGMHWGMSMDNVLEYQEEIAHSLIEAGADLIVGCHPHRIQAVEKYKGGCILYSVGNFLVHYFATGGQYVSEMRPEAVIATARFNRVDRRIEFKPIMLDGEGNPHFCGPAKASEILERLRELSQAHGTEIRIEAGVGSVPLS